MVLRDCNLVVVIRINPNAPPSPVHWMYKVWGVTEAEVTYCTNQLLSSKIALHPEFNLP